jgi:hypothetical protein
VIKIQEVQLLDRSVDNPKRLSATVMQVFCLVLIRADAGGNKWHGQDVFMTRCVMMVRVVSPRSVCE